jgi:hypothetical protein
MSRPATTELELEGLTHRHSPRMQRAVHPEATDLVLRTTALLTRGLWSESAGNHGARRVSGRVEMFCEVHGRLNRVALQVRCQVASAVSALVYTAVGVLRSSV